MIKTAAGFMFTRMFITELNENHTKLLENYSWRRENFEL